MKSKIKNIMLVILALLAAGMSNSNAQLVTLIDPVGDGGFESGSTFAANGWTVAAGVATNQWFIGNVAGPQSGSNCAYISDNGFGNTYNYNVTSVSTVYFYRDIVFPATKTRITMVINWKNVGEAFVDRPFVCYTDPANTPVVNDYLSSTPPQYATSVTGNFNSWGISASSGAAYSTMTVLLPGSFAGTTKRIMFGWQNDAQFGSTQPGAFDNISLTAEPPITCTPTANGGLWSDAASWTGGLYPGSGDDVLIPDGTSITLDVAQVIKNLTVGGGTSGVINFTTSFNALTMTGNLTVNSGGQFNGFTNAATPTGGGIQLNVAGNINLNAGGTMTMSHSGAVLNMNGTSPQSINGPGVFLGGLVRVLTIANPTSVTLNTPVTLTEGFRHYAGTLNTNGNLTLDNTAQSYGNAYNQQVYSAIVTNMGVAYPSQPTVTIAAPSGAGTQATAVANWDATSQKVRSITITNPGSGYRANPAVTFSVVGATTVAVATAVVLQSIQGNTSFQTIKNGGTTVNGGITTINNSQSVGGISITNTTANNIGYVTTPTVGFALPVRTFLCPTQGSGYTTATVSFTYPSGTVTTPATATATVVNGKVTSIVISAGGVYVGGNGTVNVVITGGNTTPATGPTLNIPVATANVTNGMVSSFTISNAGSDYVSAPTITLAGGTPTAAAAAPTCRIGLYNLQYSISSAPVGVAAPVGYTIANTAVVEGPEIPPNRKLFTLTVNNPKHLSLNDNLELTANSSAIGVSNGIINFSGANKTITCSNPAYAGASSATSATAPSFVNGIVTLTTPGGTATRTFPVGRGISIVTGTGSGAFGAAGGSDITSMTAQTDIAPTGTFTAGAYSLTGIRTYNVIKNGTQYGTGPTATVFWGVEDNLASDNAALHVAQATATSGQWTVKSIAGAAGLLGPSGSKATAATTPGPIVYNANDYFTFATNYTPPPGLNYSITRTTGNTYNSIALTGSSIPSWQGSTSTETQISNAVSLTGTTFQYQGAAVTGFRLGIDGYFTFNTAFSSNISTVQLGPSAFPITSALAAFWGNLGCANNDFTAASRDASIKYKIDGTLGSNSAIITIEWIHMTGSQNPAQNAGSDLNFQIKLFESNNHIEFNYGLMEGFNGSSQVPWSYTTGMNGSYMQSFTAPGQLLALQEHDENTTNFSYEKAQVANAGTNILHTLPACYSSYIFTPGVQVPYVPGSIIPANDEPAGAIVLTELPSPPSDYCGAKYTSYGATATLVPGVCTGNADDDVWFKFTATDPETAVKVVSSGGYDAAIQVFDASLNLLSPTVCKDTSNDGRIEIAKISGLTLSNDYYVRVYHKLGGIQATATATVANGNIATVTVTNPGSGYALPSSGSNGTPRVRVSGGGGNNGVLLAQLSGTNAAPGGITGINISSIGTGYTSPPTITIDPPSAGLSGDFAIAVYSNSPPPANDGICGPAIPLTVGVATCNAVSGTTFGATQSGGIPVCAGVADDDVFYSFVAPAGGNPVSIQVQGSASFDAVVQLLSSNNNLCSGTLTSVSCMNANLTGGLETITSTSLVAGNTYFVRVYHSTAGAGSGTFTICVFESGPPCPDQTVPPNGSLAYIGGTTLKWIASTGATGYDVYFSSVQADVINGAVAALVSSNQAGLTYATGALTNGTVYYWRVDARNAVGASVGCTVRSLTGTTDIIIGSDATVCSGNFYDSGGPSGLYQNNENSTTTICPATVGTVSSVTFTGFSLSLLQNDALSIYNGPTIASPQFAGSPFTGFPGPNGNTYTSTDNSGCITFRFTSDNDNNTGQGWSATVNCAIACSPSPTSPSNGGNLCELPNNTLSWPSNPGSSGYDVYLDNTPNPTTLVVNNQNVLSYNTGALAAGIYYWKVVNRAGAIVCANPTIWSFTVRPLPTPDAFSNSPICAGSALTLFGDNLTSGQTTGNTWSWTGPNSFTSSVQNPIIGSSSPLNTGTYNLTVTNQYGCTSAAPSQTGVTINPNPVLSIASQTNVSCTGLFDGAVDIDATSGTSPYLFDLSGSSTTDGVYTGLGAGSYSVTVIDDNSCEAAPINFTITVLSTAPPSGSAGTITPASLQACSGTVMLVNTTVISGQNVRYSWNTGTNSGTVLFSTNIGGPFSAPPFQTILPTVYAQFGTLAGSSGYNVCVQGVNGCGSTNNKCVWIRGIVSVPGTITPANPVACPNDMKNYSCGASGGATVYNWTLGGSAAQITSGQGTTNVQVTFPAAFISGQLCVTASLACGGSSTSAPRCMNITKNPAVPAAFTAGPSKVCPGATGVTFTVPVVTGATGYNWTVPAGCTITSGSGTNSIVVSFPNPYTGAPPVCVSAISACGTSVARCKTVGSNIPIQPGAMTGSTTNICNSTVQYSIANVAGASTYNWINPAGTTISSGQGSTTILLSVSSSFNTGQLTVTANTLLCIPGTSIPRTITIYGKPNTPASITANPASWCNGGFVNFSAPVVAPAVNYNWSVAQGTITAGQGSNNIDVTWGTGTGNVTVNATNTCGASSNRVQPFSSVCREEGQLTADNGQMTVYPNPAHDKITVRIYVKEAGQLNLQLSDISGRIIYSENREAAKGMNEFEMELKDFAKGIYTLELRSPANSRNWKVVKE